MPSTRGSRKGPHQLVSEGRDHVGCRPDVCAVALWKLPPRCSAAALVTLFSRKVSLSPDSCGASCSCACGHWLNVAHSLRPGS